MAKILTEEQKINLAKHLPKEWDRWEKRKVVRTRMKRAWYVKGQIITVKYFATFGCYDIKGRWVDYYDVGLPVPYNSKTPIHIHLWYLIKSIFL